MNPDNPDNPDNHESPLCASNCDCDRARRLKSSTIYACGCSSIDCLRNGCQSARQDQEQTYQTAPHRNRPVDFGKLPPVPVYRPWSDVAPLNTRPRGPIPDETRVREIVREELWSFVDGIAKSLAR